MAAGGARPGSGRKAGSPNKATLAQKATITDLAKALAPDALHTLSDIMKNGTSEAARVTAANSILDRGYGKAIQAGEKADDDTPSQTININTAAPIGEIRVTRSNP